MKLERRTILITGGSSGMGLELTKQLLARGNTVIITGRDVAKLDRVKRTLPGVHTFASDVSDPAAIAALHDEVVAAFPALDTLINNAGIMHIQRFDQGKGLDDLTQEIEVCLSGPIRMIKQFLPHLRTRSGALIVNVSSGSALVPFPISPVYSAAKAALHSFTESLRVQMKGTGVAIVELIPPVSKRRSTGASLSPRQ